MYRTASYFKNRSFEQLGVNVYEDSSCEIMILQVILDFRTKLYAVTAIPRSYEGYSQGIISGEIFKAMSFTQERNWRNRCKDYNYIVTAQL